MSKQEFLERLRKGLYGLPEEDIEERLNFYSEMIEDRIEEGISEEEAVAAVGSVEKIIGQIITDIPFAKIAIGKMKPKRRLNVWEILLLALGSPIWLSLGIAAFAVVFSLYISLWSVIISFWAVFGAFIGCSFGGLVAGVFFVCYSNIFLGGVMVAVGFVCAGLSIFIFYGCKAVTSTCLTVTKKFILWLKNRFIQKEGA